MRILTGIQPSGALHIGNYFGAIKPMLDLQKSDDNISAFIANYHAITSLQDGEKLKQNTQETAIAFLALGIDPNKTTFWVQSHVKEVLELYWILSSLTPMGLLERAHSYKDKTARGIKANHALFSYPVLMAADILLFSADVVPVGKDQIQHVEITRDIADKFNNKFGNILSLPEFKIEKNLQTIPGIDGAKMSKSYGNTIDIFKDKKAFKKDIMKIVTASTPMEEPKEYKNCNVYQLCELFMNENELSNLQDRYSGATEGYGHFKITLFELIWDYFENAREKKEYYETHLDEVQDILNDGAKKASLVAKEKILKIREVVGV